MNPAEWFRVISGAFMVVIALEMVVFLILFMKLKNTTLEINNRLKVLAIENQAYHNSINALVRSRQSRMKTMVPEGPIVRPEHSESGGKVGSQVLRRTWKGGEEGDQDDREQ